MERTQYAQIEPANITSDGIRLSPELIPPRELLANGYVLTDEGRIKLFFDAYPLANVVSSLHWSDMTVARSGTCGPLSCLIIEGRSVASIKNLLVIPFVPASSSQPHFTTGTNLLRDGLYSRIQSGFIRHLPGDLAWLLDR